MAIVVLDKWLYWPHRYNEVFLTIDSSTSFEIDAADEKAAFLVIAMKAGNISEVGFRFGSIATGATIQVRVETVDSATLPARPGGLWGANTEASLVVGATDDNEWVWVVLDADATVVVGDAFFISMQNPSVSPGDIRFSVSNYSSGHWPFHMEGTTGQLAVAIGGVKFDDGVVYEWPGTLIAGTTDGATTVVTTAVSSSTTPDHWGMRFQTSFPIPIQCSGAQFGFDDADGNGAFYLVGEDWDGTAGDALAEFTYDEDNRQSAAGGLITFVWDTLVTLQPSTWYRFIFVPTTATSSGCQYRTTADEATWKGASAQGLFMVTSAKDPTQDSDWTDFDNVSDGFHIPTMSLIINGIDDASGGGETSHTF